MEKTKAEILDELYKEAESRLLVRNKQEFAKALGYSRTRLHIKMGKNDIDDEMISKAKALVGKTKYVPRETKTVLINPANTDDEKYLDKSVLELSLANKDACHANVVLAENQRELIELLKDNFRPTADVAKESQIKLRSLLKPHLEKAAAVGVPRFWKTADEGLLELDKLLFGDRGLKKE